MLLMHIRTNLISITYNNLFGISIIMVIVLATDPPKNIVNVIKLKAPVLFSLKLNQIYGILENNTT